VVVQEEQLQKEATIADCFRGVNLKRSLISCGAFACQHFVGIVFVLGYSTYFFQLAGLETTRSFDLGVGVTACGVAGNIASWFIVDSFGRRKVFIGGMGCLTCLLLLIGIMVRPISASHHSYGEHKLNSYVRMSSLHLAPNGSKPLALLSTHSFTS
jgi:Na+/melibiose symporter-like transporter